MAHWQCCGSRHLASSMWCCGWWFPYRTPNVVGDIILRWFCSLWLWWGVLLTASLPPKPQPSPGTRSQAAPPWFGSRSSASKGAGGPPAGASSTGVRKCKHCAEPVKENDLATHQQEYVACVATHPTSFLLSSLHMVFGDMVTAGVLSIALQM